MEINVALSLQNNGIRLIMNHSRILHPPRRWRMGWCRPLSAACLPCCSDAAPPVRGVSSSCLGNPQDSWSVAGIQANIFIYAWIFKISPGWWCLTYGTVAYNQTMWVGGCPSYTNMHRYESECLMGQYTQQNVYHHYNLHITCICTCHMHIYISHAYAMCVPYNFNLHGIDQFVIMACIDYLIDVVHLYRHFIAFNLLAHFKQFAVNIFNDQLSRFTR